MVNVGDSKAYKFNEKNEAEALNENQHVCEKSEQERLIEISKKNKFTHFKNLDEFKKLDGNYQWWFSSKDGNGLKNKIIK